MSRPPIRVVRAGLGLSLSPAPSHPSRGEIVIRVLASGVNRPDLLQDAGLYPARSGQTDVLGLEVAGVVEQAGEFAHNAPHGGEFGAMGAKIGPNGAPMAPHGEGLWPQVGQEVCALVAGGAYAEMCTVKAAHCLPVPFKGEDRLARAAALPETMFTVWKNCFYEGPQTLRGKTVMVHGGAGGIGSTAIAMAKAMGSKCVQTTVSSEEKRAFCQGIGADRVFNYKREEWWRQAEKCDFILDMVGGEYLQKNIDLLENDGRLSIIGFLESPISQKVNMTRVLLKSLHITGSVLRSSSDESKARIRDDLFKYVWPMLESGELNLPHISKSFLLEDYKLAFEHMKSSNLIGKVILKP